MFPLGNDPEGRARAESLAILIAETRELCAKSRSLRQDCRQMVIEAKQSNADLVQRTRKTIDASWEQLRAVDAAIFTRNEVE